MTILQTIVSHKREVVAGRKLALPQGELVTLLPGALPVRSFRAALHDPSRPAPRVIAEVKRRSPSKGSLRPDLDPVAVATTYEQNGAAAISVLTDDRFFGGSLDDLRSVRQAVGVPVLCKEFVIDAYQIYEARLMGSDAILLIAGILTEDEMRSFREQAADLGMDALVEVHNRTELDAALASGAEIVGINNRDLHTFTVSMETTRDLRPWISDGITTVSESGISTADDRALMASLGIDALLVGESLLTAPDVALATRNICGLESPILEGSIR